MSTEALLPSNPDSNLEPCPRLPRKFGRYKLFDFIGKGGMAEIFLARAETELGGARLCVVKEIIPQLAEHPQFAEMLIFEAKLAALLNHAHIVQVFDLGRADGQLFIAMEYIEGFDLNALLRRCSQNKVALPVEFALRIVADVLGALDYAHRRMDDDGRPLGIVHRDVSPSNVLISLEGEVKLCDFGIAHANELVMTPKSVDGLPAALPERGLQLNEAIKGKAGYMSPEHARGEALDGRADVFAVGIILWELLSGKRLYRVEAGRPTLIEQARRAEIKPIPEKELPEEAKLRALVQKALAPTREDRFPSAGAMLRALEDYMAEAKMAPSPLKLGDWLVDRFGTATVQQRRARERALTESERPSPKIESVPAISPMAASEPQLLATPDVSEPARPESGVVRTSATLKEQKVETPPPSLVAATVDLGPPSNEAVKDKLTAPPSPTNRYLVVVAIVALAMIAWMIFQPR